MRKKILFVVTKSEPFGGAQRYVYDLATNLPAEYEPVVAAGPPINFIGGGAGSDSILFRKLRERGVKTITVPDLKRDISLIKEFSAFFSLIRILKSEKPAVVHLNSSKIGGLGALAARLVGVKKIIFTAHGWPYHERVGPFTCAFRWLASLATVMLAHETITVSRFDEKSAPLGLRTTMIHNGISLPFTLGSGERVRNAFPPRATITGTIGELTKNKNQGALIEEARKKSDMFVAIVGEGEDRPSLEEKIKKYGLTERVKLFGFIPAAEALPGFDRFALPSLKEGLPYALLEARAAGLPIESSRVGGVPEVLDTPWPGDFTLEQMLKKTLAVYEKANS